MANNIEKRYLIEYYVKGLSPYEQRGIHDDVKQQSSPFEREYIEDEENGFENILKKQLYTSKEKIEYILSRRREGLKGINNRMIKNKRYPLFDNPDNLKKTMSKVERLLSYLPEEECNKIMGCESFDSYVPPVYEGPMQNYRSEPESGEDQPQPGANWKDA